MMFVLMGSKLELNNYEKRKMEQYLTGEINYEKILYYSVHNRIVPILWKNVKEIGVEGKFESAVKRAFIGICTYIKNKNEIVYQEIEKINKKFSECDLRAVMLKGAILAPTIYNNIALREFGDVDFLVDFNDIPKIEKALYDIGYKQGKYDKSEKRIKPASRTEILQKKIYTHELVEFLKIDSFDKEIIHMVDVNHAIFWKGKTGRFKFDTKEMINTAKKVKMGDSFAFCLQSEYQLLQLCAHLYSEAAFFLWDSEWQRNKSEICMYRFCDIYTLINREYIDWARFLSIVQENNISEAVNYCFACLNILYGDVIGKQWFDQFTDFEEDIINRYFDKDDHEQMWNTNLFDRLFEIEKKKI